MRLFHRKNGSEHADDIRNSFEEAGVLTPNIPYTSNFITKSLPCISHATPLSLHISISEGGSDNSSSPSLSISTTPLLSLPFEATSTLRAFFLGAVGNSASGMNFSGNRSSSESTPPCCKYSTKSRTLSRRYARLGFLPACAEFTWPRRLSIPRLFCPAVFTLSRIRSRLATEIP